MTLVATDRVTREQRTLHRCAECGYLGRLASLGRWRLDSPTSPFCGGECTPGELGLWVVGADGPATRVTTAASWTWAWSPTKERLAFVTAAGPRGPRPVRSATGERRTVTTDLEICRCRHQLLDGTRIAVASTTSASVIDFVSGASTSLGPVGQVGEGVRGRQAGRRSYSMTYSNGRNRIVAVNADGSNSPIVLVDSGLIRGPWRARVVPGRLDESRTCERLSNRDRPIGSRSRCRSSGPTAPTHTTLPRRMLVGDWSGPVWSPDGDSPSPSTTTSMSSTSDCWWSTPTAAAPRADRRARVRRLAPGMTISQRSSRRRVTRGGDTALMTSKARTRFTRHLLIAATWRCSRAVGPATRRPGPAATSGSSSPPPSVAPGTGNASSRAPFASAVTSCSWIAQARRGRADRGHVARGLGRDSVAWDAAREALTTRTCAYDRRNIGLAKVPGTSSATDAVEDLRGLLEAAGVEPPYVLAGHSFGGLLSLLYAGTYPDEVAGIVLVDATLPLEWALDPPGDHPPGEEGKTEQQRRADRLLRRRTDDGCGARTVCRTSDHGSCTGSSRRTSRLGGRCLLRSPPEVRAESSTEGIARGARRV